ncbi:hypothetical protein M6B38_171220 [Iris pallida]|uniref:Uncharacterized protein n=1 Tax=Iris pallida TaxID=29817 RepID=A0AAX6EUZ7_IRIPA|nr:hypothetical protein M6B38_171220 [Iris pallida]
MQTTTAEGGYRDSHRDPAWRRETQTAQIWVLESRVTTTRNMRSDGGRCGRFWSGPGRIVGDDNSWTNLAAAWDG